MKCQSGSSTSAFATIVTLLLSICPISHSQGGTDHNAIALEKAFINSAVNCTDFACYVHLSESNFYIASPVTVEDIDVYLIGLGSGAVIWCSYNVSGVPKHSFRFARSNTVLLQNLHFRHCPEPISIEEVGLVEIHNSSFRYFTEAVFDIFNCVGVNFTDSVLEHNRGASLSFISSNRGNTGGLAIGYNGLNSSSDVWVEIRDCSFVDNVASANSLDESLRDSSLINLLDLDVYRGRGGAVGLWLFDANVKVLIFGCFFKGNRALYGGGVYVSLNGPPGLMSHKARIENCNFVENFADIGAAGVIAAFRVSGNVSDPMLAEVLGCNFTSNTARDVAGGVGFTIADSRSDAGVQARLERCIFKDNKANGFGSAARFTVINIFLERSVVTPHEVIDCTFIGNEGLQGTLGVAHVPLRIGGTVLFESNIGQGLRVIGSIVTVDGDLKFIGNDASRDGTKGGALYVSSFGQIMIKKNSNILFENNNGSIGSAIVVDSQRVSSTYSKLLFNPQCFLLYEDITVPPSNWTMASIVFRGNRAANGADVFATSLSSCSWFSFTTPFFNVKEFQNWTIFNQTALHVQTDPERFRIQSEDGVVDFRSGLPTKLNPVLLDQFGRGTIGTLQLVQDSNQTFAILSEPSVLVVTSQQSAEVTFSIATPTDVQPPRVGEQVTGTLQARDLDRNTLTSLNVSMVACPPGQSLRAHSISKSTDVHDCQCNNALKPHIVLCDDEKNIVLLQLGYWGNYAGSTLYGHACPPGFCRCHDAASFSSRACYPSYNISHPEAQCVCGRQGILCGQCSSPSSGLTALYLHCQEDCPWPWGMTFLVAVLLQAVAVAFIVFFNVTLPSWMVPILFYIKMASFYAINFPPTFEQFAKYLYFFSNLLSLYFPYDFCIPGASALGVFAARYMTLLVAGTVGPLAWILNRKRKGVGSYGGTVTLFYLLFTHTMYTTLQILNCPLIYDSSNQQVPRWFFDGEQKCFQSSHIPLGLLALAVLGMFVALCILLVVIVSAKVKRRWIWRLRTVLEKDLFGESKSWWILVEVVCRFSLILILVIFPRSTIAPLIALSVMLYVYGYYKPFVTAFSNYLHIGLLVGLSLLIAISANQFFLENLFTLVSGSVASTDCPTVDLAGVTWMSILLLPFYYVPLVLSCLAVGCYLITKCIRSYRSRNKITLSEAKASLTRKRSQSSSCAVTEHELALYHET